MKSQLAAHVAGIAIKFAISKTSFSVSDIQSELTEQRNHEHIYRALEQLEADGWIENDTTSSIERWHSGPLAREYGNTVKFSQPDEGTIPVLPDERSHREVQ